MSDIVSFGPFLLRTDWLVFLLSGVGGYVFLNGRLAECLTYREKIKDILLGAAFIYLIAWKVSPAIFSPSLIIDNPLGILYFPVGNRGVVLAILITCIYTGFRLYREKIPFVMFANSSVFFIFHGRIYLLSISTSRRTTGNMGMDKRIELFRKRLSSHPFVPNFLLFVVDPMGLHPKKTLA